jgi:hypothetical protein
MIWGFLVFLLAFILQQKDEKLDNIKQDYEIRIKEKDKQTSDLQDRIQSYLYDLNGEPWCFILSSFSSFCCRIKASFSLSHTT